MPAVAMDGTGLPVPASGALELLRESSSFRTRVAQFLHEACTSSMTGAPNLTLVSPNRSHLPAFGPHSVPCVPLASSASLPSSLLGAVRIPFYCASPPCSSTVLSLSPVLLSTHPLSLLLPSLSPPQCLLGLHNGLPRSEYLRSPPCRRQFWTS